MCGICENTKNLFKYSPLKHPMYSFVFTFYTQLEDIIIIKNFLYIDK